jgi:hypothetical protein
MRTSFHHQPEAQHPNFQLSTSWQADYPIFWGEADVLRPLALPASVVNDPKRTDIAKSTWMTQNATSAVPNGPTLQAACSRSAVMERNASAAS